MPIFNSNLYNSGVCCINDLLDDGGKLLTYQKLINKYNTNINFLRYMGIIDAIPQNWRKQLATCHFPLNIMNNNEAPHLKINSQFKNIKQVKSREIYIELLKRDESTPTCIKSWNDRLELNFSIDD